MGDVTVHVHVNEMTAKLSPAQRKVLEARVTNSIAEEMTLRQLSSASKLTQIRMAKALGISQDGVSRLEKRSDLLLSTLRKTVEAMGGSLSLVAEFPDQPPVLVTSLGGDDAPPKPSGRTHKRAHGHHFRDRTNERPWEKTKASRRSQ
jgi:transcriptional regulator with XRE-family HTH domain